MSAEISRHFIGVQKENFQDHFSTKLHFVQNASRKFVKFPPKPGNPYDVSCGEEVLASRTGTVVGDGGYGSATLQDSLAKEGIRFIASIAQTWFQSPGKKKDSPKTGRLWRLWSEYLKISSGKHFPVSTPPNLPILPSVFVSFISKLVLIFTKLPHVHRIFTLHKKGEKCNRRQKFLGSITISTTLLLKILPIRQFSGGYDFFQIFDGRWQF